MKRSDEDVNLVVTASGRAFWALRTPCGSSGNACSTWDRSAWRKRRRRRWRPINSGRASTFSGRRRNRKNTKPATFARPRILQRSPNWTPDWTRWYKAPVWMCRSIAFLLFHTHPVTTRSRNTVTTWPWISSTSSIDSITGMLLLKLLFKQNNWHFQVKEVSAEEISALGFHGDIPAATSTIAVRHRHQFMSFFLSSPLSFMSLDAGGPRNQRAKSQRSIAAPSSSFQRRCCRQTRLE